MSHKISTILKLLIYCGFDSKESLECVNSNLDDEYNSIERIESYLKNQFQPETRLKLSKVLTLLNNSETLNKQDFGYKVSAIVTEFNESQTNEINEKLMHAYMNQVELQLKRSKFTIKLQRDKDYRLIVNGDGQVQFHCTFCKGIVAVPFRKNIHISNISKHIQTNKHIQIHTNKQIQQTQTNKQIHTDKLN